MVSEGLNQNASAGFIEHFTLQMKLAQRRQRTALLSVGGRDTKIKLLGSMQQLTKMGYQLYATYKTHKFLRSNGVEAILVNKIATPELKPNLGDMLAAKRFDIIINIPTQTEREETLAREKTDGQVIREMAVSSDTPLITSLSVANEMIAKLARAKV